MYQLQEMLAIAFQQKWSMRYQLLDATGPSTNVGAATFWSS